MKALLVLEDGRSFGGESFGAGGESFGEIVFNTAMTGYQETLTDPSYASQIVVQTAPQIGNTGMNNEDPESGRIQVAGYVVREPSRIVSNWRATGSLDDALAEAGVVGLAGIDTRALVRHIRQAGAMRAVISTTDLDPKSLHAKVLASPGMVGADLAQKVCTPEPYVVEAAGTKRHVVAALDLGMKSSIPHYLALRGCEVHVFPAATPAAELLAIDPDGLFLSNGPGDPAAASYAIETTAGLLESRVPLFGICFGNQILGHALGLTTYKLRFGHRGSNQPVKDLTTGKIAITSHNHGFAVDAPVGESFDTPYGRAEVSHIDANDQVVEGLHCLDTPAFSVQYHPEAAPGPHDALGLFDDFTRLMAHSKTRS